MMNSNRTKSLRLHALYFINLFVFFSINDIEREREKKSIRKISKIEYSSRGMSKKKSLATECSKATHIYVRKKTREHGILANELMFDLDAIFA